VAALEPGQVDVEAVAPDFARSRVAALNLAGETTRQDFVLDRGASIRGRVVDNAGAPIAGAEVTAVSEDAEADAKDAIQGPGGSSFAERMRVRSSVGLLLALTDERGGFELANLSEGSYTVLARASGYEEAQRTGVRAGEEVKDIPLSRFSAVRGTVA
jgi:hypothetical protein